MAGDTVQAGVEARAVGDANEGSEEARRADEWLTLCPQAAWRRDEVSRMMGCGVPFSIGICTATVRSANMRAGHAAEERRSPRASVSFDFLRQFFGIRLGLLVLDLAGHSGRATTHSPRASGSRGRVEFHRADFRVEGDGKKLPKHTRITRVFCQKRRFPAKINPSKSAAKSPQPALFELVAGNSKLVEARGVEPLFRKTRFSTSCEVFSSCSPTTKNTDGR